LAMNEKMIERLKKIARSECYFDDEDENKVVYDYSGSNVDDAFDLGERQGEILLARDILSDMGISWVE